MTPLEKTLKRHLAIDGVDYVITLSPQSLKITVKNHRLGVELPWKELVSGETALAVALHASVGKFVDASEKVPASQEKGRPSAREAPKPRASGKKQAQSARRKKVPATRR